MFPCPSLLASSFSGTDTPPSPPASHPLICPHHVLCASPSTASFHTHAFLHIVAVALAHTHTYTHGLVQCLQLPVPLHFQFLPSCMYLADGELGTFPCSGIVVLCSDSDACLSRQPQTGHLSHLSSLYSGWCCSGNDRLTWHAGGDGGRDITYPQHSLILHACLAILCWAGLPPGLSFSS